MAYALLVVLYCFVSVSDVAAVAAPAVHFSGLSDLPVHVPGGDVTIRGIVTLQNSMELLGPFLDLLGCIV